jgi:hypothetical protein
MEFEEFGDVYERIQRWFRPNLNDTQIELYFSELSHFPLRAFHELTGKFIKQRRPIKSNLPTIDEYHQEFKTWLKDNPEFITLSYQKQKCDDCNSTGLLHFRRFEENYINGGMWVEYTAVCANCNNWRQYFNSKRGKLVITREGIISRGWEIYPKDYPEDRNKFPGSPSKSDIKELTKDIGKKIPF